MDVVKNGILALRMVKRKGQEDRSANPKDCYRCRFVAVCHLRWLRSTQWNEHNAQPRT